MRKVCNQALRSSARVSLAAAVLAIGGATLSACGSDSSESANGGAATGSGGASTTAAPASGPLAEVRKMVQDASQGAVLGPGAGPVKLPLEPLTPEQGAASIEPEPLEPGDPKSVVVVSCGPTATCEHLGRLMVQIVEKIGWKGSIVQAQQVAPGPSQVAFNSALGQKPDGIISIGIAGSIVGPQLAKAKQQGTYTVLINGTDLGGKGYDAYLGGGYSLAASVLAGKMIDEQDGKANIFYAQVPEIPYLGIIEGTQFVKEYCPDCTLTEQKVPVPTLMQPVKMGQFATSMVRKNRELDFFANPSTDVQVQAASQAFRSAGSDAKVVASNLNGTTAMAGLSSGDLPFIAGPPLEWSALQGVDAVIRGLAGKPARAPEDTKIGVYLMTKENAPENPDNAEGPVDRWAVKQFDFVAPYSEAWGVDLSPIAANSK